MPAVIGTNQTETLMGTTDEDQIVGLAGDDQITGSSGADTIYGDFVSENLLNGTEGATSFAQYSEDAAWTVTTDADGHSSMSQTVETIQDATYSVSFDLAANYGAGTVSGAVEVLWNGVVIDSFDTNSAVFEAHEINFSGTGGAGELTFRSVESDDDSSAPVINTDGPVFYYEKSIMIDGEAVTVQAFAEGQTNIYQVMNGQLNVFDVETETYSPAGASATVGINAIGFNQEDDLIYGIAVGNGVDALGNAVSRSDLVMIDATGDAYRIGPSPYASWTADFDDSGNLWAFQSSMDRVTMIDVDQFDADGNPVATTFKFPKDMITDKMWDVAFDAATQTFYGLVRPNSEGGPGKLYSIDISEVANGGEPIFSSITIDGTMIDGVMHSGMPAITFGALIIDGDGNLYAGGNGGDHDMDDSTGTSGGIYRIDLDPNTGAYFLTLVADAPKAYSNDGAIDPRSMDPFTEVDVSAGVLIRSPEMVPTTGADQTYDDTVNGNGGQDTIAGGLGEDIVIGASLGDTLSGDDDDDAIYGGAGPDSPPNGLISVYDDDGNRFDQFGNPLPEDDDVLYGGAGNDLMSGSAGHDTLNGGSGDDTLTGGSGSDNLSGGSGDDSMSSGSGDDVILGGEGNDVLKGGSGADSLDGGNGNDSLYGGSGDDDVLGGKGNDVIDSGAGDDDVQGGYGNDRIKSGSGNDTVSGGDGNDYINGHTGDDVIDGGAGKDKIYGGSGADVITGGDDSDTFVFRSGDLDGSTDQITDFTRGGGQSDRIDLRGLDLLDGGLSQSEWIAENITNNNDGTFTIDIGNGAIILNDHLNLGDTFLDTLSDGLLM
ncbi:DUF6923 family protein [Cochlodiniinecator piscidefendens]|uniref:DUF6923 family protein n=1 Tax=Cochlodiniinecator piscidefendens TaxID=2715756 RepID=UPI00140B3848|nr:type I secretion protein [Cochlodiniinecator piscidefendens]